MLRAEAPAQGARGSAESPHPVAAAELLLGVSPPSPLGERAGQFLPRWAVGGLVAQGGRREPGHGRESREWKKGRQTWAVL